MNTLRRIVSSVLPGCVLCRLALLNKCLFSSRDVKNLRRMGKQVFLKIGSPKRVMGGPMRGLRLPYLDHTWGSAFLPKIVGTYESELHDFLEAIISLEPDILVNIGCGEGYYAVGMALRMPHCRIMAYDVAGTARYLTSRLARLAGVVRRVEVRRRCSPEQLNALLASARCPVVICDIEGDEDELLDPSSAPALSKTVAVVEVHDGARPGVSRRLSERFQPTHRVTFIATAERAPPVGFEAAGLSSDERTLLTAELRSNSTGWLHMTPRSGAGRGSC